jgi:hypothetical protein
LDINGPGAFVVQVGPKSIWNCLVQIQLWHDSQLARVHGAVQGHLRHLKHNVAESALLTGVCVWHATVCLLQVQDGADQASMLAPAAHQNTSVLIAVCLLCVSPAALLPCCRCKMELIKPAVDWRKAGVKVNTRSLADCCLCVYCVTRFAAGARWS